MGTRREREGGIGGGGGRNGGKERMGKGRERCLIRRWKSFAATNGCEKKRKKIQAERRKEEEKEGLDKEGVWGGEGGKVGVIGEGGGRGGGGEDEEGGEGKGGVSL